MIKISAISNNNAWTNDMKMPLYILTLNKQTNIIAIIVEWIKLDIVPSIVLYTNGYVMETNNITKQVANLDFVIFLFSEIIANIKAVIVNDAPPIKSFIISNITCELLC